MWGEVPLRSVMSVVGQWEGKVSCFFLVSCLSLEIRALPAGAEVCPVHHAFRGLLAIQRSP